MTLVSLQAQAQAARDSKPIQAHSGSVNALAFSPDGKCVATAGEDMLAKVWEVSSGKELFTLKAHTARLTTVTFSPDGKYLLTAGWDDTARIWDAKTGKLLRSLPGAGGSVAFSPDGKRIASSTKGGEMNALLWDAEAATILRTFKGTGNGNAIAFSPDGKKVATGSGNADTGPGGEVMVWDAETGKNICTTKLDSSVIGTLSFSSDGTKVLVGIVPQTAAGEPDTSVKQDVRILEAETGKTLTRLEGAGVMAAYTGDYTHIVTGAADGALAVWVAAAPYEKKEIKSPKASLVSVASSQDGSLIAAGYADGLVRISDAPGKGPSGEKRSAGSMPVFELRTYHAAAGKLDDLNARFRDHTVKLFAKHGITSVAYFTPQPNDGNKLIYLLAFPNSEARDKSFKEFGEDPEWKSAFAASEANGKLVDKVDSVIMAPTDYNASLSKKAAGDGWIPIDMAKLKAGESKPKVDSLTFELRTYTANPGKLDALNARFRDHTCKLFAKHGMQNLIYCVPVSKKDGADDTLIYLIAHKSRAEADKDWAGFGTDPDWIAARDASEKDGKILAKPPVSIYLVPTDYSPIR